MSRPTLKKRPRITPPNVKDRVYKSCIFKSTKNKGGNTIQDKPLKGLNLNLSRLHLIRYIAIIGQTAALFFIDYVWPNTLAFSEIITIILSLFTINLLTYWRLKHPVKVTHMEFFVQLLIDLFGLSALLYFSGGANNPFVSYFLVPLCISAAILPWRYTWFFAALAMTAYSILLFYYVPLETLTPDGHYLSTHQHGGHMSHNSHSIAMKNDSTLMPPLNLHIIGMWINFIFSTALITYFVVKMAQALKEQDEILNQQIEQRLRDEQILSIATQAAGTAHELGTPLSTLTILLEELKYGSNSLSSSDSDRYKEDIALMEQQVNTCKTILQRLSTTAQQHSLNDLKPITCDVFFENVITHWQVLSPSAVFQLVKNSKSPAPLIQNNPTIEQALINLLNNASRESDSAIKLNTRWTDTHFYIEIEDDGPGFPEFVLKQTGKSLPETSTDGLGLGLMLTTASIEKNGGTILLTNTKKGAKVSVTLPSVSTKN